MDDFRILYIKQRVVECFSMANASLGVKSLYNSTESPKAVLI